MNTIFASHFSFILSNAYISSPKEFQPFRVFLANNSTLEQYRDLSDDEFNTLVEQTVNEYDDFWKPCILLHVDG